MDLFDIRKQVISELFAEPYEPGTRRLICRCEYRWWNRGYPVVQIVVKDGTTESVDCFHGLALLSGLSDLQPQPTQCHARRQHEHQHRPQAELQPAAAGLRGVGWGGGHVGNPWVHR